MAAPSIVASTSDVPKPLLVAVLASASLLISTLFNLVIPLIPVLPGELNASPGNTSWVVTAFFLVGAVANPVAGRLADMVGNRRVLIVCVWLLVVGSVVCALASTLPVLLAGRVLQGMSLPMMSISLSIMRQQLVIVRLPAAVGWATAAMGIGNGAGLIGGGYLIDTFSWNAVFWATAVISLPLAVAVPLVVPRDHRADPQRLDATGAAGLVAILVLLLLPLSTMGDWGVTPVTVGLLAAGIALTPVWARGRLRRDDPIVDLASLRRRTTAATHLTAVAAGFTGFMCFVVTSHALQADEPHGFGLSLTEAGVFMTPASMSFLLIGPVTSQLILRLGMRRTLMIGGTITAAGAIGIALDGTSLPALFVFSFVVFIGNGTLMSSLPVATAAYSDPQDIGSTNGVNALARTTGIAFASGVFALVVGSLATDAVAGVLAWTEGLSAVVAASIVGMCAITIPRRPRRDDASGSGSR